MQVSKVQLEVVLVKPRVSGLQSVKVFESDKVQSRCWHSAGMESPTSHFTADKYPNPKIISPATQTKSASPICCLCVETTIYSYLPSMYSCLLLLVSLLTEVAINLFSLVKTRQTHITPPLMENLDTYIFYTGPSQPQNLTIISF